MPILQADVVAGPGGTLTFQRPVILTGSIQWRAWQISYTAAVPGGPSANCTAELCRCAKADAWGDETLRTGACMPGTSHIRMLIAQVDGIGARAPTWVHSTAGCQRHALVVPQRNAKAVPCVRHLPCTQRHQWQRAQPAQVPALPGDRPGARRPPTSMLMRAPAERGYALRPRSATAQLKPAHYAAARWCLMRTCDGFQQR